MTREETDHSEEVTADEDRSPTKRQRLFAVGIFSAVTFLVLITGNHSRSGLSVEALHRSKVAQDLLKGQSRGRQGLVGSMSLPPLPTVLAGILSVLPWVEPAPLFWSLIAAISALILILYANRLWHAEGVSPWLRYPALCGLLIFPPVAMSIDSGQTTMLFVLLVVCGWGFLLNWLRQFELRHLAYAALLLGLSVGVRYQAIFLLLVAGLLVFCAVLLEHRSPSLLEGSAVTFFTPGVYVIILWIGANWLILGNPVFFLRGLAHSIRIGTAEAGAILTTNCEWTTLALVALFVLSVPAAGSLVPGRKGKKFRNFVGIAALLIVATVIFFDSHFSHNRPVGNRIHAGRKRLLTSGIRRTDPRVREVVFELEQRFPNASFIVTGYEGYEFRRASGRDEQQAWIHLMHLESQKLESLLEDFTGRRIYLLINTQDRVERWHELGLEWRGRHSRIPEHFLYVDRVGPWMLFETIRSQEPLLIREAG